MFQRNTPGRHRAPSHSSTRVAATAVGLTAAFLAPVAGATAASAATSDDFARLRACESGGNYSINTGNGYYGAYQFNLGTWRSVGGSGYPHQASPATQDALAAKLQSQRGWSPWPACSARLGLGSGSSGGAQAATVVDRPAARASRSQVRTSSYAGTLLTTRYVSSFRCRREDPAGPARGQGLLPRGRRLLRPGDPGRRHRIPVRREHRGRRHRRPADLGRGVLIRRS